ncbi:drug/metabolite transporter (DMT)-like permease [Salinibacter ruber]|jgi:drug/metabolite transporter (DMT)-like permease|uniref:Integral membrane protein, putative n=2 Tax=Salinibacter ruber TaxID=146919 RepID=Q2S2W1_SALRD|nr:membrane protein [Salinibacter ruber]ABC46085.1 integral membrane protein, putative [Salinibacter ruber DSM 13855]MBB4060579.1 drug/metabolite transporter (DMT)-like permease [Salinibacter ruber]MBB4068617.1 drug/metabolite transporter (DMT)-like permease [Salinibacter ruber]MCS3638994.1 drug/metabolite transporter (DMT)-like permease [Salinibacter ruber]MCS3707505.1 drug/metabolite transporter (DMT)-like permease [Salinibacter ruber]
MIFLVFAVASSVTIGMIFKHASRQQLDRTALLTVNYAAAVAVAVGLLAVGGREIDQGLALSGTLVALGAGTGAVLIAGFFVLAWATEVAGMSLAIGVMRVSVVVPFLASWGVWGEVPSPAQGVGMVLAMGAFFLLAHQRSAPDPVPAGGGATTEPTAPSRSPVWSHVDWLAAGVLALTFCAGGAIDVLMKTFEEGFGAENSRVLFLLLAFGVAFLVGAVIVLRRGLRDGAWPTLQTVGWGVLLGLANYASLEFLLRAIEGLPGTFVFPANNIAIMVLAALLGVVVWGERLSRPNRIGLGLGCVALVLLGL